MSTTSQKPALETPAEESNRVQIGLLSRMLGRPEIGALVAAIVIGIFFLIVAPPFRSAESLATVLYQSATIGIVAVAVGMLMIGGEFDLSAGVMVTTAGLVNAMFSYEYNLNLWVGAVVSLVVALAIGFLNGYLVMRTGIPSFLIIGPQKATSCSMRALKPLASSVPLVSPSFIACSMRGNLIPASIAVSSFFTASGATPAGASSPYQFSMTMSG